MRKIKLITIFSTFLFDLIIKLLALLCLEYNKPIYITSNSYFELTYNNSATNNTLVELGYSSSKDSILFILVGVIIGSGIVICRRYIIRKWARVVGYLGFIIIGILIPYIISLSIQPIIISNYISTIFRFIGPILLLIVLCIISNNRIYSIIFSLLLGAGLGNLINQFYPPFAVIDYIYIGQLNKTIGLGVFNFADLTIEIAIVIAIIYFPVYSIFEITKHRKKDK
jgi:lipoprotein signal peptidase